MRATSKCAESGCIYIAPSTNTVSILGKNGWTFVVSTLSGLILAVILIPIVWPLFGWEVTRTQSLLVMAMMIAYSSARSFIVRWLFDKFWRN
ncbi:MAG: DUF7220 family protein [Pikeienuella sp.]